MKKTLAVLIGVVIGFTVHTAISAVTRRSRTVPVCTQSLVRPVVSTPNEISTSRVNAIVLAARRVSPAVVSITVTQTRVVTNPFWSPFGDDPFYWFFRDFAPRREYRQQVKAMGSGLVVNEEGYVITNAHVVENASEIKVTAPDGKEYDAELIEVSSHQDLALLKLKSGRIPPAPLGNSNEVIIGEWAIALGNPFGYLLEDPKPTVTVGVVSAVNRSIRAGSSEGREYRNMIQTDAAINPGNSGGPLVNAEGEVIGINTFIFSKSGGSEGVGFAIPINEVKAWVAEVQRSQKEMGIEVKPDRFTCKVGIVLSDVTRSLKKKYRVTVEYGAIVLEVKPNSIAEAASVEEGDVILKVSNQTVRNAREAQALLDKSGRSLDMVILRGGSQIRMIYRF